MELHIKRAYEPARPEDGERYLVDRLWPRGVKTKTLVPTRWLKDVAPSDAIRRWFGHDPVRWMGFHPRYWDELKSPRKTLQAMRLALVYSAHDEAHNQAVVLREYLLETTSSSRKARRTGQRRGATRSTL